MREPRQPKGVVLRHAAFTTALGSAFSSRILREDLPFPWEMSVCFFSLPFVAAIIDICIIFSAERTMLLPTDREQYSVDLLTDLIARHRPDIVASTLSVILRFLEDPAFAEVFTGFMYVFFGGERLTPEVAKKVSRVSKGLLIVIYGSTEMFFSAEFFYRNDALYPDASEGSRRPRWMHKQVSAGRLPSREELLSAVRKTDFPGFRTLRAGANAFLGREEAKAAPEILTVDIRGKQKRESGDSLSGGSRAALIQGYMRMEELRGFKPEEVPCRLTLFPRDGVSGELLATWDARFIHPSAVDWLLEQIRS